MDYLVYGAQIIVALGIINVWLLRFSQATPYRGGASRNMKEEFAAYGLPEWSVYVIGALKLTGAGLLLGGFYCAPLTLYGAGLMSLLMLGAVLMHVRVGDSLMKTFPALTMLILSLYVLLSVM